MKMQLFVKWSVFLAFFMAAAVPAGWSQVGAPEYTWGDKLTRGAVNIVTSPVEIPRTINQVSREDGAAVGWTAGLVRGVGRTLLRAGAGAVEVVTFPFDWPEEGKEPILEPRYAWEEWDKPAF